MSESPTRSIVNAHCIHNCMYSFLKDVHWQLCESYRFSFCSSRYAWYWECISNQVMRRATCFTVSALSLHAHWKPESSSLSNIWILKFVATQCRQLPQLHTLAVYVQTTTVLPHALGNSYIYCSSFQSTEFPVWPAWLLSLQCSRNNLNESVCQCRQCTAGEQSLDGLR